MARRGSWLRWTAAALSAAALLAGSGVLTAAPASAEGRLSFVGHGYGHGRGLGQWGALGYAVDYGWSAGQILDRYYGGTTGGSVGNPPISVELTAWRGRGLVAEAPGITINGTPAGNTDVWIARTGVNTFTFATAPTCGGPWTAPQPLPPGPVVVASPSGEVETCEAGSLRGFQGDVGVVERGSDSTVVARMPTETYLRGVVPRESPASWSDLGGGRGAAALQAQAVAARSYLLSGMYAVYANACDTTTCQVYGGAWTRAMGGAGRVSLYDPRTDAAISATAGHVRFQNGRVARTEFSASTGGWSAGGNFPAVQDLGDAYATNPNRVWTSTFTLSDLSSRLGVGQVLGLSVTSRNGLGADGGRVLTVRVSTTGGPVTLSGNDVRSRLGLKSDWFTPSALPYDQALAFSHGVFHDLLGRDPSSSDLGPFAAQVTLNGFTNSAYAVAASTERAYRLIAADYQGALARSPGSNEQAGWAPVFVSTGSVAYLHVGIYGSAEALAVAHGNPLEWVDHVYLGVLGRHAGAAEQAAWAGAAAQSGLASVVSAISTSAEARNRLLDGYYTAMLGRHPDPGGASTFLGQLGAGNGDILVPMQISNSAEYIGLALARYPS